MKRKKPWLIVAASGMALGALLMIGGVAWWRYASYVPPYTPPVVSLPVPNAYDDYVDAAWVLKSTSRLKPTYQGDMPREELRELAADSRPALTRLRQGFRHEFLNPPVTSYSVPFPELAEYRELARRLAVEGRLAELEGRLPDAADSYLDGLRLGTDIPRGGPLIHALVGLAVEALMLRPLDDAVERLDGPTAARAARRMAELDADRVRADEILAAERDAGYAGLMEMMRNSRGSWKDLVSSLNPGGSGGLSWQDLTYGVQFAFTPKRVLLENYRDYMDRVIVQAKLPYHQQGPIPEPPNDPLSQALIPVFGAARFRTTVQDARWRVLLVRLAARAYEIEHGRPAPSLQALVPKYLARVPEDPFAPHPLVYRVVDGKVLVYSRGPDGDDDGGQDLGYKVEEGSNGDLVTLKSK